MTRESKATTPIVRLALAWVLMLSICAGGGAQPAFNERTTVLTLRSKPQTLHLYGVRGGAAVILSSGDGGWMHLGPQVAGWLASQGYFVVGVDARAYLESFTSGSLTLSANNVASDLAALAEFAAPGATGKPVLVGVSEGAGLSVLAAADPKLHARVGGVVTLGLPDINELGWRWRDAVIYLTHGVPKEPTFSAAAAIGRLAPLPVALIQSTHDEFVSTAETERLMAAAAEPKRLWVVPAADHRFSDNVAGLNRALSDALVWVRQHATS